MRRCVACLLVLALALSAPARADGLSLPESTWAKDWTTGDTVRQGVLIGLQVIDWRQTSYGLKHGFKEDNPLLGKHPSQGELNNAVALSIIGVAAISYLLPRGWRDAWQYVWIGAEIAAVSHNRSIGMKLSF